MNNQTIVCCVVALLLGMLLANMLQNVCGCKVVEGQRLDNTGDYINDVGAATAQIYPLTILTNEERTKFNKFFQNP